MACSRTLHNVTKVLAHHLFSYEGDGLVVAVRYGLFPYLRLLLELHHRKPVRQEPYLMYVSTLSRENASRDCEHTRRESVH